MLPPSLATVPPAATGRPTSSPAPELLLLTAPGDPPRLAEVLTRVADAAALTCRVEPVAAARESVLRPRPTDRVGVTALTPGAVAELATEGGQVPRDAAGLLVVTEDADDPGLLHHALALGCNRVLSVDDELGLLARVRGARDLAVREALPRGRTVGVRSVVGGAGASSLAAALALAAHDPVVLVDADASGAGPEPLLGDRWDGPGATRRAGATGQEGVPGWARLADLSGQVDPALLLDRLPGDHALRVVGHGTGPRTPPPASRLALVTDAAARAGWSVVIDLPREGRDHPTVDDEVWVVPCTVPGLEAAGRRLVDATPTHRTAAPGRRWVVARHARAGLHPEEVAAVLGLSLLAEVRRDPRLDEHVALGLGVAPRRRSAWSRAARRCLDGLGLDGGAS